MICPNCKKEIEPVEEENSAVSVVKDKQCRMKTWTEETRDSDGTLLSRRVDEYTYAPSGEIDTIRQKVYDSEGALLSDKTIEHYTDGRQPIVEEVEDEKAGK